MPLFDYTCEKCAHRFEFLVRDGEKAKCPECGAARLTRHLGVPAVHSTSSSSLPVCGTPSAEAGPCGPGFCRTGMCGFDG